MMQQPFHLPHKEAEGYVIPLGPLNLVFIATDIGLVGCGAIDVKALDRFGYPAAKARPGRGDIIATLEDLCGGVIREVNKNASARGIKEGIPVREALLLL
ncbi:MAG: YunC family protein [Methanomicrobiales archaeon]|nr:YunC family protein [Methanomicrobiales archaeon]